jgi:hypothetical protein
MEALADVVRVLFEPTAVFQRVRERPRFLVPFLVIAAVQIVLAIVNMPFVMQVMRSQMGEVPAGSPDPSKFAWIGIIFAPLGILIFMLIATLVLWVLVSILGGDGKFGTLLSVVVYAAVPSVLLAGIIGALVLQLRGAEGLTSMLDLQPPLGLDLLAPSVTGFAGAVLKGINPFSIWGLVLTAIGVSETHRLSRSTGYTVAVIYFVIALLIGAMFAGMSGMGGAGGARG